MPTSVRRTVCFSEAVRLGEAEVEGIRGVRCESAEEATKVAATGTIAVLVDPKGESIPKLAPEAVVDAILAKQNLGTTKDMAPVVIGVGPGFVPGNIGGYTTERVLRAPADGPFEPIAKIGDQVKKGDLVARVSGEPLYATIDGVLRGLLQEGCPVTKGMKSGDIDPRCKVGHCFSVSDKARAVGGGVLEALLHFSHRLEG